MSNPTIAVSSTFTAAPIGVSLLSWIGEFNLPYDLKFAPYGQVLRSLIEPNSVLVTERGGFNVLLIRLEDWAQSTPEKLANRADELATAVKSFAKRSLSQTLVCFCPNSPKSNEVVTRATEAAEGQITQELHDTAGIYVVTSHELAETYPVNDYFDDISDRTGHIPYSRAFYAGLGTMVARRIYVLQRKPAKVIVLDCDNTLWSGACGEVGASGVQISAAHQAFQRRMLTLREQGLLLALCSKNVEQDVWNVFDQNDAMVLKREHIAAAEINWDPKSQNLRCLATNLGLGCDSLVLLDDNPVEIGEVHANCPAATAVQVPESTRISTVLDHVWPLDRLTVTSEDLRRAESYRVEAQRQGQRNEFVSLRQFLEQLELKIDFQRATDKRLARVSQLIERTNQFNVTLSRQSSAELSNALNDTSRIAQTVEVSDKFGDYGLVGFILGQQSEGMLRIDSFLLSCRALGRGVEHHMLRHVGAMAEELGLNTVAIRFVRGPRNEPAASFLKSVGEAFGSQVGGTPDGDVEYRLPTTVLQRIDPLDVTDVPQVAPDASNSEANGSIHTVTSSQIVNRIANQYQTVDQILDRLSSEAKPRPEIEEPYVAPTSDLECVLADICSEALHIDKVGVNDSLHDLGGTSLHIVQIYSQLVRQLKSDISITDLYTMPTIRAISDRMESNGDQSRPPQMVREIPSRRTQHVAGNHGVAVIGMAGRFPGADNVAEFWQNLIDGVNSIVEIPEDELNLPLDSPLRSNPNLVRMSAGVKDADKFDARFFGIFPKEALVMDPQHRLMLECCWHAIEDAGYCPDAIDASVGVFAGCYMDTYILASMASNPKLLMSLANSFHGGDLHTELGNDKDYLATRISFLLNLRGPSLTIQTACSTSLVAIIQACQAIESGQCEMALAGGSTLKLPQKRGYLYSEGGMVSPDGICRTFDADARGTVFGEGVGAVLLKPVDAAIADGDDIYGVIRGWGINNDGHSKMGYTAPSVDGQSTAVLMAHQHAGCSADTITYMEAHGTGTALGDPIEIDALTKAFRATTDKNQFCAIGSVKSNIGHLDVAAGVTGLMKSCLAMRHGVIPATLNFKRPNPNIDFESSPFFVASEQQQWQPDGIPRRAGISSFGVGGTNAHIVVEEAPRRRLTTASQRPQLLVLSAKSENALNQMTADLALHLRQQPDVDIGDLAFTLQVGRKTHNYSRTLVANDIAEAAQLLSTPDQPGVFTHHQVRRDVPVTFMFPGQGSQHINMGHDLYKSDAVFRQHFDECCDLLVSHLGFDLRDKIFTAERDEAAEELKRTSIAQPAIFAISYSLAQRLESIGIVPERMIGHSVGEFVAACLAGVFSLPDALRTIAFRAEHMQQCPTGSMLAVRMTESELSSHLNNSGVEIAAMNGPTICVVAGETPRVEALQQELEANEVICRPLQTSHAFHSAMMEPVIEPIADMLKTVTLNAPKIPIISSVNGETLSDALAKDPMYWARHLRETVRFTDSVDHVLTQTENTLLEVGAGQTLSTLARQHPSYPKGRVVLSTLPHAKKSDSPTDHFLATIGRLWQAGVSVDWAALNHGESHNRVHLPTYPFERKRFWFDESQGTDQISLTAETDDPTDCAKGETNSIMGTICEASTNEHTTDIPADPAVDMVIKQQLEIMKRQLEAWNSI